MTERRYGDGEVRKILELATRPEAVGPHPESGADGLTLSDIQSIALEVGIAPEAVSRAATTLDVSATPARKSWGMPIEVARTVPLRRALTDHEWDQLVAELRATFRARGRVMVQGGLREWANGNLHACVEPTDDGYRLRLDTIKGNAAGMNALGATGIAAGALVIGAGVLTGGAVEAVFGPMLLATSGVGALLANLLRLPRWAQQRERQMEHIEARISTIVADSAKGELEA
jgi:hypothetical protein